MKQYSFPHCVTVMIHLTSIDRKPTNLSSREYILKDTEGLWNSGSEMPLEQGIWILQRLPSSPHYFSLLTWLISLTFFRFPTCASLIHMAGNMVNLVVSILHFIFYDPRYININFSLKTGWN